MEQIVLEEIAQIQESGPTEDERQLAVTKFEASTPSTPRPARALAYAYGLAETTWTLDAELRYVDSLRKVTREQIRDAARRYLPRTDYARLAFVPRADQMSRAGARSVLGLASSWRVAARGAARGGRPARGDQPGAAAQRAHRPRAREHDRAASSAYSLRSAWARAGRPATTRASPTWSSS